MDAHIQTVDPDVHKNEKGLNRDKWNLQTTECAKETDDYVVTEGPIVIQRSKPWSFEIIKEPAVLLMHVCIFYMQPPLKEEKTLGHLLPLHEHAQGWFGLNMQGNELLGDGLRLWVIFQLAHVL